MPPLTGLRPHGRRLNRRILVAMLAVALLPLAALTLLVGADLSEVNQATVDQARQTIVADAQQREASAAASAAGTVQSDIGGLSGDLAALAASIDASLKDSTAAPVSVVPLGGGVSLVETGAVGATLLSANNGAVSNGVYADPLGAGRAPVVAALDGLRRHHPEVTAVWLYNSAAGALTETPVRDPAALASFLENDRVDPAHLLDRQLAAAARESPPSSSAGSGVSGRGPAILWSDVDTAAFGAGSSVTAWAPAGSGGWEVGLELPTPSVAAVLPAIVSTLPDAWSGVVSSSGQWVTAGAGAMRDLGLGSGYEGSAAAIPGVPATTWASNAPQRLQASIAGIVRDVFTAPVGGVHWTVVSAVPDRDIAPAAAALGEGLRSAERQILLLQVLPLAIVLAAVAITLSWLFSRRLVGPVRALTASAERLAQGHTDEPVPRQGTDEVGLLSEALERMRAEVNTQREELLEAARELEQRVADRTAELSDRNEELVALNALGRTLTRSLDPGELVEGAVRTLGAILPARAVAAYTIDGGPPVRSAVTPGGGDIGVLDRAAAVAATGQPPARDDLLAAPVTIGGDTLSVLMVALTPGADIPERLRTLVGAVADQLALALRTAQLSAEGRELAVLEERTRLAREIHDTIAQQLTGIVLQLEATATLLGRDDTARSRGLVIAARDQARLALAEARRSVWNLRPVPLDAAGLAGAVSLEVDRLRERTGIVATVRNHGVPVHLALQPQAEVALFRILQEALSNVARHSNARHVEVSLRAVDGDLHLVVTDDGRGFDTATTDDAAHSFGLVGMRERAELIGARFTVTSAPGAGTAIALAVPLQPQTAVADA